MDPDTERDTATDGGFPNSDERLVLDEESDGLEELELAADFMAAGSEGGA